MEEEEKKKYPKRGFGSMSKEKRQEIAALGGISAHKMGKAHEYTAETGRVAGRVGGKVTAQRKKQRKEEGVI